MSRLPSAGFTYLVVMFGLFVAACWWLIRPHWFELEGAEKTHALIHYQLDVAAAADGHVRTSWANQAIDTGLRDARLSGNGEPLLAALEQMHGTDLLPPARGGRRLDGGHTWLLGVDAEGRGLANQPMTVIVRNPADGVRSFELRWAADSDAAGTVQMFGDQPVELSFVNGAALHTVEAAGHACLVLQVQTSTPQGLRFVGARPAEAAVR